MKPRVLFLILLLLLPLCVNAQRAELKKMSPMLRAKVLADGSLYSDGRKKASVKSSSPVCLFVRVSGDVSDLYSENGCEELASFGDIQIVSIPRSRLLDVARDSRIKRLEMGRRNEVANAYSAGVMNASGAHEGLLLPQAYTGKGVVMGIEDIGFDLTNPNFYSRDMSEYRIKALWDMLSPDTIGSSFIVGNDYVGQTELLAYEHSYDGTICHHGSHTLGSAAGSGYNSDYRGMAYDADICLVANCTTDNSELISEEDEDKYTYATDALGFKYIFDYAESVGKPCVISFSEGSYQDLYGDDLLFYEVLEELTGEGRIIVSSAGNNSLEECYIHKPAGQERAGTFIQRWGTMLYFYAQADREFTTRIVVHADEPDTLTIDSEWLCAQPDSLVYDTLTIGGIEYDLAYAAYPNCYDPDRLVIEYMIQGPEKIGYSSVAPISIEFMGEDADIEVYKVYGNFVTNSIDPTLSDAEVSHNIFSPSSAPSVICVGATAYATGYVNMQGDSLTYNYGENGVRASFSSVGPTHDGRTKPDVMAPGANIVSSTNSFFFEENPESNQWSDLIGSYEYDGRTYYWKYDTGTSMSSPLVGGAIALWLQAKPDLTMDDIMEVFAATCIHPDESLEYPNNYYGYGQIDVYAGLLHILGLDGIEEISRRQASGVTFSVEDGGTVRLKFDTPLAEKADVKVFSVSGQLLGSSSVPAGTASFSLSVPAASGSVVAVQVNGRGGFVSGSTLLRLL